MKHNSPSHKTRARLTRRGFIQSTSAVMGSPLMMMPRHAQAASGTSLEGYTSSPSVVAGGTIDFFLRDPLAAGGGTTSYPLSFTRIGAPDVSMLVTSVVVGNQVVPADASTLGCRWARSYQLAVPANWPSGLYFAYLGSGENACTVPFVVRPASATAGVKALLLVPVTTVHAYNAYGGKSIYDFNSSGGVRAPQVSLDRPFTEAFNSFFDSYSQHLVRWLAKNKLAVDFCTDIDIEANPGLLASYQLYVQAGHDEYWSVARRNTMDTFVARGGNAAYLGGNTMWFQARLAPSAAGVANRTLVCYKDAAADPVADPALKTVEWVNLATPRPENSSLGTGFANGCSWVGAQPRPNTPSVVMRSEHWAFAGTGLAQGSGFGGAYVGYEADASQFVLGAADGRPHPTGADGAPATLRILAQADGSNWNALSLAAGGGGEQSGYAQIAVFSNGGRAGTVFTSGSTDWAYGLIPELNGQTPTPISRITLNVINKLSSTWAETADVRQFRKALSGALFNSYYSTGTSAPAGSGMALDGLAFRAFVAATTGSVPVYRFRSSTPGSTGTRYRYNLNPALDSFWVQEGVAFHAYASARADATPVYEHYLLNAELQEFSTCCSTSATPPAGWTAGPVRFHAPTEGINNPAPGFTLSAPTTTLLAIAGKAVSSAITVAGSNGVASAVGFAVTGLPTGVTASFAPTSSATGTTLTLSTSAAVATGSYTVTVNGSAAGGLPVASLVFTLVVAAAAAPSFTLTATPTTVRMILSGLVGDSSCIVVNGKNGFKAPVSFSVSGLPAGVVASFQPATATGGTTVYLQRSSYGLLPSGCHLLTIKGVSGSLTASTSLALTVTPWF